MSFDEIVNTSAMIFESVPVNIPPNSTLKFNAVNDESIKSKLPPFEIVIFESNSPLKPTRIIFTPEPIIQSLPSEGNTGNSILGLMSFVDKLFNLEIDSSESIAWTFVFWSTNGKVTIPLILLISLNLWTLTTIPSRTFSPDKSVISILVSKYFSAPLTWIKFSLIVVVP